MERMKHLRLWFSQSSNVSLTLHAILNNIDGASSRNQQIYTVVRASMVLVAFAHSHKF